MPASNRVNGARYTMHDALNARLNSLAHLSIPGWRGGKGPHGARSDEESALEYRRDGRSQSPCPSLTVVNSHRLDAKNLSRSREKVFEKV